MDGCEISIGVINKVKTVCKNITTRVKYCFVDFTQYFEK